MSNPNVVEKKPKTGEFWIVQIHGRANEVVLVLTSHVYPCGDEQGWLHSDVTQWIRKIKI